MPGGFEIDTKHVDGRVKHTVKKIDASSRFT